MSPPRPSGLRMPCTVLDHLCQYFVCALGALYCILNLIVCWWFVSATLNWLTGREPDPSMLRLWETGESNKSYKRFAKAHTHARGGCWAFSYSILYISLFLTPPGKNLIGLRSNSTVLPDKQHGLRYNSCLCIGPSYGTDLNSWPQVLRGSSFDLRNNLTLVQNNLYVTLFVKTRPKSQNRIILRRQALKFDFERSIYSDFNLSDILNENKIQVLY